MPAKPAVQAVLDVIGANQVPACATDPGISRHHGVASGSLVTTKCKLAVGSNPTPSAPFVPRSLIAWYDYGMSGTHTVIVGDRGRLVVPAEVRERAGLVEGTALVLLETPSGIVLMTRAQLRKRVQAELSGLDLVGELLAERRAMAANEDLA